MARSIHNMDFSKHPFVTILQGYIRSRYPVSIHSWANHLHLKSEHWIIFLKIILAQWGLIENSYPLTTSVITMIMYVHYIYKISTTSLQRIYHSFNFKRVNRPNYTSILIMQNVSIYMSSRQGTWKRNTRENYSTKWACSINIQETNEKHGSNEFFFFKWSN